MTEPRFTARAGIEAHQLGRLRSVIEAIQRDNPFWSARLRAAGIDGGVESLGAFFERMPLLTKAELSADQEQHPPYGTNLTYPTERYTRLHQTSSTTGRPLRWLDTPEDWQWLLDGWQAVFDAAGVTRDDRAFFAFSFGPFIGFWMAWDAALRLGCRCIPGGAMNTTTRLAAIFANGATLLCCTPTYAIRLGETARQEGFDLAAAPLQRIIVGGEPGASIPAVRARIERLWSGARLFDHHGMTEVGPVTYECPRRPGVLHVNEAMYLCEIVDPESGLGRPGDAEGELVITTLGRAGSPVLRYRTGDLVRAETGPCECGRVTMRFPGGILGRNDDMIVVRGTNLYPGALDAVMGRFAEVAEYRAEIGERGGMVELQVVVEPAADAGDAAALCARVERALRDAWNLRIPVRAAAPGELPRFDLKARRWVRLET